MIFHIGCKLKIDVKSVL